ncbi:hypothetical protein M422DRAFT_159661, partial [Sphaerobolus stellatus SS14]
LSALEHVHNYRLVHRDVKPKNLLCSKNDRSEKIDMINFGMSKPWAPYIEREKPKPLIGMKLIENKNTHYINNDITIDLSPRDGLESLAYTAFLLLRDNLPWLSFKRTKRF